jgi:superfamily II DNA helicase RecQ
MNSFTYLAEYQIVVCKECRYGVTGDGINLHLKGKKHGDVLPEERKRIREQVCRIPGLIKSETELKDFRFPAVTSPAIPELLPPRTDGMRCKSCLFVCRDRSGMQKHCRDKHQWINPQLKGRRRLTQAEKEREMPWVCGVHCQRFFGQGINSHWFEVERIEVTEGPVEDILNRVRRITAAGLDRVQKRRREVIVAGDQSREPNLWLRRVGWDQHLAGIDRPALLASIQAVDPVKERVLFGICSSFKRMIQQAQQTTVRSMAMLSTLFEVNRKERGKKARKPFDSRMEPESFTRYIGVWIQVLCYLYRTHDWTTTKRPGYRLTSQQEKALEQLGIVVQELITIQDARHEDTAVNQDEEAKQAEVDKACLGLCVRLLDHQLTQSEYDSVLVSALAVMGMREEEGWEGAENYTWRYSAVIKLARMMVVRLAYVQREQEVATRVAGGMDEQAARERSKGMWDRVHRSMDRFMVIVSEETKPTPMDWIFESRSYGMKIWYTTAAEGTVDWIDEQTIQYQKIKLRMDQVRDLVGGLVEEARQELNMLMFVPVDEHGDIDESCIPALDLTQLEDDHSDYTVGMSFLDDIRNRWPVDGKHWLMDRVCVEEALTREWIRTDIAEDQVPFQRPAIEAYQRRIERFLELILVILHMVGGQPPRATEILGMRYCNTSNGGFRNIVIYKGQVCYIAAYHKNYRSSEQIKLIHRYLPREMGELLVRYIWLVLPFWQQVQVVARDADEVSPFLWDEDFARRSKDYTDPAREEGSRGRGESQSGPDEDEGYSSSTEFDFSTVYRSQKWTSERLRRILQECSKRYTGVEINISAWRHLVIAISRKFLQGTFKGDNVDDIDLDAFDDEDSPWDLQAGHGTHVAGMIYARLLQQDPRGTSSRQEQFRTISRIWHLFLGFEEPAHSDMKRKRETFEEEAQEVQYQRFKRLARVDIRYQMQMFMGAEVKFRGLQEPAIQAIMQGESPVVQVTGTGGGKSLSFMLPAYCVPGGVTVVVVPLVALQEDLHNRCQQSRIDSVIWESSRPSRVASVIFVTPEAAISKTFRTFVNRMQRTCKLDRVVFDECHTVLDCGPTFRPKILKLGRTLVQIGAQLVFLTATLPPRDVERFFKIMRIPHQHGVPAPGVLFRASTVRRNIRYAVIESGEITEHEMIQQVVQEKLATYQDNSKIIIYGSSITRVKQLGELLQCPIYHRNVDSRDGKRRIMEAWRSGQSGRVIVATNALGLGVDIPDIRVVIHDGQPRQIRDYAQESGRAGRDGTASEAIIVCREVPQGVESWICASQIDIPEFMSGRGCRRIIMDRIMDGNQERTGCVKGEEACDVCKQQILSTYDSGVGPDQQSQEDLLKDQQLRDRFMQQQQERGWLAHQLQVADQEDAIQVHELVQQLEKWVDRCSWCMANHFSNSREHLLSDCTEHGASIVQDYCKEFTSLIHAKNAIGRFTGCFRCYVPQAICQHWAAKSEGGLWEVDSTQECQFAGVVIPVFWSMVVQGGEGILALIQEQSSREGYYQVRDNNDEFLEWLMGPVEWGKVESTHLVKMFLYLSKCFS